MLKFHARESSVTRARSARRCERACAYDSAVRVSSSALRRAVQRHRVRVRVCAPAHALCALVCRGTAPRCARVRDEPLHFPLERAPVRPAGAHGPHRGRRADTDATVQRHARAFAHARRRGMGAATCAAAQMGTDSARAQSRAHPRAYARAPHASHVHLRRRAAVRICKCAALSARLVRAPPLSPRAPTAATARATRLPERASRAPLPARPAPAPRHGAAALH
eukprot:IDg12502t1